MIFCRWFCGKIDTGANCPSQRFYAESLKATENLHSSCLNFYQVSQFDMAPPFSILHGSYPSLDPTLLLNVSELIRMTLVNILSRTYYSFQLNFIRGFNRVSSDLENLEISRNLETDPKNKESQGILTKQ